jgi:glycosyltransferase involved in cell wall biosynthesis
LTHLKEILINANPSKYGFEKVVIWSSEATLNCLPDPDWIIKASHSYLNKSFLWSFFYQIALLSKSAKKKYSCDVLFVPGGTFFGSFRNVVSMSQNMLPFEKEESDRFPSWKSQLKFKILYYTQSQTFKKSKGVVFLTKYAQDYISKCINIKSSSRVIIPHGINLSFLNEPKKQKDINNYTTESPFKLLYVSIVLAYKHQWNVAEAVLKLKKEGFPIIENCKVLNKDIYNCINVGGLIL